MRLPNGYGSVVKLGGNRRKPFAVRVTVGWKDDGKQIYKYLGYYETKPQALEALVSYNRNPFDVDLRKITLKEVWQLWKEEHFCDISASTAKGYDNAYKKIAHFEKMPFAKIKTDQWQSVFNENKGSSVLAVVKTALKMLYAFAMRKEIVDFDKSAAIKIPKYSKKKQKGTFEEKHMREIWERRNETDYAILSILFFTGMRIKELLVLEQANIDIEKRIMVGGLKTENGIDRQIPIHKDILPLIEKRLNGGKYLFLNTRGNPIKYDSMLARYNALKARHGITQTMHETRHTFVSQARRLKIDDVTIKRIVGHGNEDVTDVYTHKNTRDLLEAIDAFYYDFL